MCVLCFFYINLQQKCRRLIGWMRLWGMKIATLFHFLLVLLFFLCLSMCFRYIYIPFQVKKKQKRFFYHSLFFELLATSFLLCTALDTERKLNVYKTFRRWPEQFTSCVQWESRHIIETEFLLSDFIENTSILNKTPREIKILHKIYLHWPLRTTYCVFQNI